MTKKCFWLLCLLAGLWLPGVSSALAEQECIVRPDVGVANVTYADTGAPATNFTPGDRVYSMGLPWGSLYAFVVEQGEFREISGLSWSLLDCEGSSRSSEYPVVFEGLEGRIQLYEEFGLEMDR